MQFDLSKVVDSRGVLEKERKKEKVANDNRGCRQPLSTFEKCKDIWTKGSSKRIVFLEIIPKHVDPPPSRYI